MAAWLALWCAFPVLATLWVLHRRSRDLFRECGPATRAAYIVTVLSEHGAVACQCTALVALSGARPMLRTFAYGMSWAVVVAVVTMYQLLDAALYVQAGMRMEWRLVTFAQALTEFLTDTPWRLQAAAMVVCAGVAAGASVVVQGSTAALTPQDASPLALASFLLVGVAALLRGRLPVALSYAWNNRLLAVQRRWANHARSRLRQRKETGFPAALLSQREESTVFAPAYPLMRTTTRFVGKKHFDVKLDFAERPHIVFLFMESFRAADTGVLGAPHTHSVTPCFDALARQGALWTQFYANGTTTSRAMTASLFGLLPSFNEYSTQGQQKPPNLRGIPQILSERGYLPAFFCDGPMEWENKRDFFFKHGFPLFYGAPSIKEMYPEAPQSVWNFPDTYLMRFHAEWLARHDARNMPTFSTLLTVTNHTPFEAPKDAAFPDVDVDRSTEYYKFLRTMMYTDASLGLYMDLLRARGLDKKTIFFITADNGQRFDAQGDLSWSGSYTDAGLRVPLLVLAPGRLQPSEISETASQIDLMPTLLDMLDINTTNHGVGTSLLRKCSTRQALSVHPWAPDMVSNRFGQYRYVYSFDTGEPALYDMGETHVEGRDVAAFHPDLVATQTAQVWGVRNALNTLYDTKSIAPPVEEKPAVFPRLYDAPSAFPTSLAASQTRHNELSRILRNDRDNAAARLELNMYMALKNVHDLDEADRLKAIQLYSQRLWLAQMGELNNAERAELQRLHARVIAALEAPGMPVTVRMLATPLQRLARTKAIDSMTGPAAPPVTKP